MRILQINVTYNWGSHGRIAEDIGQLVIEKGGKNYIAFGRYSNLGISQPIKIGSQWGIYKHVIQTRLFDRHGLASKSATRKLVKKIQEIKPDIIHLHNIHGYYLNYRILFNFLSTIDTPIVWTLHDCWAFTGHCSHFTFIQCEYWKAKCHNCPQLKEYPSSLFFDRSEKNYVDKQKAFTIIKNMTIIPVSHWLSDEVKQSFLKKYPIKVIHNGINLDNFTPQNISKSDKRIKSKFVILGVANVWSNRKGLIDFIRLQQLLSKDYSIILIGLSARQIKQLPKGIIGIQRTNSIKELAEYYSISDVFLNPTWEDTFPTTNLEALACGTPVITYRTGGCIEAIDDKTGAIVEPGNIKQLAEKTEWMCNRRDIEQVRIDCRKRAVELFDKNNRYEDYYQLYLKLLNRI